MALSMSLNASSWEATVGDGNCLRSSACIVSLDHLIGYCGTEDAELGRTLL